MDCWEGEVRALEEARAAADPAGGCVAFYGSSSIVLWTTLATDFPGERIANLGFGGSSLDACAWFFDRLVVPYRPRSVLLYAGDNDLADGRRPEDVLASLRDLLDQAEGSLGGTPITFLSIKASLARWHLNEEIRRANALAQEEMARRPFTHYLDVCSRMLGSDGRPRPELFVDDGLHLSPAGYALWRQAVLEHRHWVF